MYCKRFVEERCEKYNEMHLPSMDACRIVVQEINGQWRHSSLHVLETGTLPSGVYGLGLAIKKRSHALRTS